MNTKDVKQLQQFRRWIGEITDARGEITVSGTENLKRMAEYYELRDRLLGPLLDAYLSQREALEKIIGSHDGFESCLKGEEKIHRFCANCRQPRDLGHGERCYKLIAIKALGE
ncbi:MAG: hypothetical protein MJA83_10230 [Gammaproteobacteria bacterium]|nr:hypothetical protein [Gammaproteobacteria bacterium]